MATVFLNGEFVGSDTARVSAFDAGFQHGVGLFETMLATAHDGTTAVLHLDEHLSRLAASSRALSLTQTLRTGALAEAVRRVAERGASDHPSTPRLRVRLTLTGGDLNLLNTARGEPVEASPTLLITAQPASDYPAEMFARGINVTIADWKANPLDPHQGHKTLNYWPRLRELQTAAGKRGAEALVFQVTNHLCGGCVSNAFIIKHGVMLTPTARGEEDQIAQEADAAAATGNRYDPPTKGAVMPSPVLPGIVRRWVMDWALENGMEVRRRLITISDVLDADEVILTNSGWGVLPVAAVEARPIGSGQPGPIARRLITEWNELTW